MIRVGQYNTLEVDREVRGDWILTDGEDTVLLPALHAPWDIQIGNDVEVFVYTDTHDNRVATSQKPAGVVGQFACVEVVDISGPGAFCDWGLDKDLLIPHAKLHERVEVGDRVVVALVLDRDQRVMAVSRLHPYFEDDTSQLAVGKAVKLMVYGDTDRGFLMVVDGRWGGMLFFDQTHDDLGIGQEISGFIQGIREDGRLDLSLHPPREKRQIMADDITAVATEIQAHGGFLPLTDKSPPEDIRRALRMSKKAFKRAVGGLYKTRKIEIESDGIRWIAESSGSTLAD